MDQKNIWNDRYEKHISKYDLGNEDVWIKKYECYFAEKQDKTIIDLGCGSGINSYYLYDNGYDVIACDFSYAALEIIEKNNNQIPTLCFDMTQCIPVENKNIGIVLASLSTHYFSFRDTIALYRNIYDILEYSGYFIFRVNSIKEYECNDKDKTLDIIEENYYRLKSGAVKRYFNTSIMTNLLKDFKIIELVESEFFYFGNKKYFIDGIVQKI